MTRLFLRWITPHKTKIAFIAILCLLTLNGCGLFRPRRYIPTIPLTEMSEQVVEPTEEFFPGETLIYNVRWLGLDVGTATLSTKNKTSIYGRPAYHVVLHAETNKIFSFLYQVKGEAETYYDAKTLRPIMHESETQVRHKYSFKRTYYDFERNMAYSEDNKESHYVEIGPEILDPLGIFFFFRFNDVDFSEPIKMLIQGGDENYPVELAVIGQRMLKVPAGSYPAFQVKPTPESERQFDDELDTPGSLKMWFSLGRRRIPLTINLDVPVGSAQAVLRLDHLPRK